MRFFHAERRGVGTSAARRDFLMGRNGKSVQSERERAWRRVSAAPLLTVVRTDGTIPAIQLAKAEIRVYTPSLPGCAHPDP